MKKRVRYYESFTDDFEVSKNQDFELPNDYKWVKKDLFSRILSAVVYALALLFSSVYCYLFLHMRVYGKEKLKKAKGGFFIYGNHTQPIGDVFIPALAVFPRRIYTVVSTANYGIPIIGKILPYLGALPIAKTLGGLRELNSAISYRLKKGNPIVIYPEAHVWEYYTKIRPFPKTSFSFPVKFGCPAYAMTVTYRKSKLFKKPLMEVFLDGPFYGEKSKLHSDIFSAMQERSKHSDFEYIEYKKK